MKAETAESSRARRRNVLCAQLIERISGGDEEALDRLYHETRSLLGSVTQSLIGDPEAAEEAIMDSYLQVWRTAARYDSTRGNPLAWLITIARTRALDQRRSLIRRSRLQTDDFPAVDPSSCTQDPEEASFASERSRKVRDALRRLSPEQRQVIFSAYYEGQSHGEMARSLGIPLGTIKTRVRLAMRNLKGSLIAPELAGLAH